MELGFNDYGAEVRIGLVAPAKTPQHRISQIASRFMEALQAPEMKPSLLARGLIPRGICGAGFAAHLHVSSNMPEPAGKRILKENRFVRAWLAAAGWWPSRGSAHPGYGPPRPDR
jgi:tripartite-type tricarboxylate transporter receptor subunit TctC